MPASLKTKCSVMEYLAKEAKENAESGDIGGVRGALLGVSINLIMAFGQIGEGDLAREISACIRMWRKCRPEHQQDGESK